MGTKTHLKEMGVRRRGQELLNTREDLGILNQKTDKIVTQESLQSE